MKWCQAVLFALRIEVVIETVMMTTNHGKITETHNGEKKNKVDELTYSS
jgi:hypothetical protein